MTLRVSNSRFKVRQKIGEKMIDRMIEVHSTKKYDMFHLLKKNRPIYEKHVDAMVKDPTFPSKFKEFPILVTSDFYVVDGQHRWKAAEKLGIPVYYAIDPKAKKEDVNLRNSRNKPWVIKDHVMFHSHDKTTYAFILKMMQDHAVPANFINSAAMKITGKSNRSFNKDLRDGNINLEEHMEEIKNFLDEYVPKIREHRRLYAKGSVEGTFLFMETYIQAFAHYFKYDRAVFNKALEKLLISNLPLKYTNTYEEARQYVLNLSKWKPERVRKAV